MGLTFDVLGDRSLALKGHWGRYYDNLYVRGFKGLSESNWESWGYYILDMDLWKSSYAAGNPDPASYEVWWYDPGRGTNVSVDDDLEQAYMDQWTVGLEYELWKDTSIGVTYINRNHKELQGQIPINSKWIPEEIENPLGGTITVYKADYNVNATTSVSPTTGCYWCPMSTAKLLAQSITILRA